VNGIYSPNNITSRNFNATYKYNDIDDIIFKQLRQYEEIKAGGNISVSESAIGSYNMSFIFGPRPHLPIQIIEYTPNDVRKHCIIYDAEGQTLKRASSDKRGGVHNVTSTTIDSDWEKLCENFYLGHESNPSYKLSLMEIVWDEENQVRSISKDKKPPVHFIRNLNNQRTVKSGEYGMSLYFNSFFTQDKSRRAKYIYIPGALVSMKYTEDSYRCGPPFGIDQQGCQYFFHDDSGSPHWITDNRGLPMMHFEYIPASGEKWVFETITSQSAPTSSHQYPFGFEYQEYDTETDLYYKHGGHYFDPHLSIPLTSNAKK